MKKKGINVVDFPTNKDIKKTIMHKSIMRRKREHDEFHEGSDYCGLMLSIDEEGKFLCSSLGNIDNDTAEHLIQSVSESLVLEMVKSAKN